MKYNNQSFFGKAMIVALAALVVEIGLLFALPYVFNVPLVPHSFEANPTTVRATQTFVHTVSFDDPLSITYEYPKVDIGNDGAALKAHNDTSDVIALDPIKITEDNRLLTFKEDAEIGADSSITYQLSGDWMRWYYFDGDKWIPTGDCDDCSSTAEVINQNISTLPIGTEEVLVKAFLKSGAKTVPKLKSVAISVWGERPSTYQSLAQLTGQDQDRSDVSLEVLSANFACSDDGTGLVGSITVRNTGERTTGTGIYIENVTQPPSTGSQYLGTGVVNGNPTVGPGQTVTVNVFIAFSGPYNGETINDKWMIRSENENPNKPPQSNYFNVTWSGPCDEPPPPETELICHSGGDENGPWTFLEVEVGSHDSHTYDIIPITDLNGDGQINIADCNYTPPPEYEDICHSEGDENGPWSFLTIEVGTHDAHPYDMIPATDRNNDGQINIDDCNYTPPEPIDICHSEGDENGPWSFLTVEVGTHDSHPYDIIPITDRNNDGQINIDDCNYVPPESIEICHSDGDENGPWSFLTVEVGSHDSHPYDIIPITDRNNDGQINVDDCNYVPPEPILICHSDGDENGPFSFLEVNVGSEHEQHEYDVIPITDLDGDGDIDVDDCKKN
ncbi:hypothetical protein ACFL1U_03545 [Patescibacteria group bacterium]